MKHHQTTALLAAAIAFAFTACDKKTADTGTGKPAEPAKPAVVDEKTAIANFKNDVDGVTKWIEEKQKTVATDPAAGMAMMGEIVSKFKGIKTDALPADLKGAWGDFGNAMTEMSDLMKGMPTAKPDKPEDAAKAMEILPKIMAIQAKIEPAAKKLEEIGKKYDLDMSKVGGPK